MKHKTNASPFAKATGDRGPGLIVALGAPSDDAGKMGQSGSSTLPGDDNALSDAANTDTVPLSMLAMPDDQEQMQPPEVGDVVNYQVTGKVVAIEGGYAKVQRQSINGQEVQNDDETNGGNDNPQNANASDYGGSNDLRSQAAGIGMLS